MSIHQKLFVLATVLSIVLPAAAAERVIDLTDSSCSDQVEMTMGPSHVLLARGRIDAVAVTPFVPMPKQSRKMLPETVSFSDDGRTMRWLYSTLAEKRIFATYTAPRRGRPAELRINVRLSLL